MKSYKCYNGTTEGYIMSYVWETTRPRQSMRVAFSVDRPVYEMGDSVLAMVRTDGYWTRDSGWWYIVKNAFVNLTFYYPNNSMVFGINDQQTDSSGLWENKSAVFIDKNFPYGRYKANVSVRGPASGGPGQPVSLSGMSANGTNMTVYFDVGGELNVTLSPLPSSSKNKNVSINGTVRQPNGQMFNSSFVLGVPGFSSYYVNISVMRPDGVIDRSAVLTTTGNYNVSYNTTRIGTYYVIANVEYDLGNQVLRGKHTYGRNVDSFVVYGTWPEVGLSFVQDPASAVLVVFFVFFLRRRGDSG